MLTLPREMPPRRAMMSSMDRASPVKKSRPWISAMVGLTPHRALMRRHRPTNSCSTASSVEESSDGIGFMAFGSFRRT